MPMYQMEHYLKHLKEITDNLAAIGTCKEEEHQVVTVPGSLPRNYSELVRALEARVDDVNLLIQQTLINEKQKQKSSHIGGEVSALLRAGYIKLKPGPQTHTTTMPSRPSHLSKNAWLSQAHSNGRSFG